MPQSNLDVHANVPVVSRVKTSKLKEDFLICGSNCKDGLLSPGAATERGDAVASGPKESDAPAAATGGGRVAQSESRTASEAAARTGKETEIGIGTRIKKKTETKEGRKTKSGHQKKKVRPSVS